MTRVAKNPGIGAGKGGGRKSGSRLTSHRGRAWEEIGDYILNTGAYRYVKTISKMDDEKFLNRFETMLEYFKPKLGRVELSNDKENPISFNLVNFTITEKDLDRLPTLAEHKQMNQVVTVTPEKNDTGIQVQAETVSDTVFKSF